MASRKAPSGPWRRMGSRMLPLLLFGSQTLASSLLETPPQRPQAQSTLPGRWHLSLAAEGCFQTGPSAVLGAGPRVLGPAGAGMCRMLKWVSRVNARWVRNVTAPKCGAG